MEDDLGAADCGVDALVRTEIAFYELDVAEERCQVFAAAG